MKTPLLQIFEEQLADVYDAEKSIVKSLPKLIKASQTEKLKTAFENHLEETNEHVARLEAVFKLLDKPARAKKCNAIAGILQEADELTQSFSNNAANDAALICAAQKVEHYEIATYGTLATWADQLGMTDAANYLRATLKEENNADITLTKLAESGINKHAQAMRSH